MYSQQTVVFVHVATKRSYWNKCSVCVSILLPYKSALPTAVVWSVDNLPRNTRHPFYHSEASVSNLREHAEVHQSQHLADILRIYTWFFLFSTPVHTGPPRGGRAGVTRLGHGVDHPPHQAPRLRISTVIPLLLICASQGMLRGDLHLLHCQKFWQFCSERCCK